MRRISYRYKLRLLQHDYHYQEPCKGKYGSVGFILGKFRYLMGAPRVLRCVLWGPSRLMRWTYEKGWEWV